MINIEESISTRSYIKNFGRVSHRLRNNESINIGMDKIGCVEAVWSIDDNDWRFIGSMIVGDMSYSTTHLTLEFAKKWIESKQYELKRHQSFGDWLRFFLDHSNMSRSKFAHNLSVSRQIVHLWINNESLPSVDTFINISRLAKPWLDSPINLILLDMSQSIVLLDMDQSID